MADTVEKRLLDLFTSLRTRDGHLACAVGFSVDIFAGNWG